MKGLFKSMFDYWISDENDDGLEDAPKNPKVGTRFKDEEDDTWIWDGKEWNIEKDEENLDKQFPQMPSIEELLCPKDRVYIISKDSHGQVMSINYIKDLK